MVPVVVLTPERAPEGFRRTTSSAVAFVIAVNVVEIEREAAAEVMDSSPSNVENLQLRGAEKVAAAEELVAGLDALVAPAGEVGDGKSDEKSEADGEPETDDRIGDGIAD